MPRIDLPQRGLHLEYESHGSEADPAILLVMGLGMQLLAWPPQMIRALVDGGLRVVVFDNRDAGLSGGGALRRHTPLRRAALAAFWRLPFTPPYRIADMADDTLALADALGIARFHLVGASLGGMIAQSLAEAVPERVLSLTSIMSSAGPDAAPWPKLPVMLRFLRRPPKRGSLERKVDFFVDLFKVLGRIRDPQELQTLRARMTRTVQRAYNPPGTLRQLLAIMADPDRSPAVARIRVPTLIVHGIEDPLVPVKAAHTLARLLPRARLELIPELGHYLPAWVAPVLAGHILDLVESVAPPQPAHA